MGRYEPLLGFLEAQQGDRIPATFEEIERLLGVPLPASKRYPAWWSNNPSNNPMTKVWLAAGFVTEQVDTAAEKLVFRRAAPAAEGMADSARPLRRDPGLLERLRASLGGTVRFAPDFDPTEPTGEIWDAQR